MVKRPQCLQAIRASTLGAGQARLPATEAADRAGGGLRKNLALAAIRAGTTGA
jgi:hypothetical protein